MNEIDIVEKFEKKCCYFYQKEYDFCTTVICKIKNNLFDILSRFTNDVISVTGHFFLHWKFC